MGTSYEFGPPADELDPRRRDGLEPWQGKRQLSQGQLEELVRIVEAEGWTVEELRGSCYVQPRLSESSFEELFFTAGGGWLSKPSRDPDEFEAEFDLVRTICDYAGWVGFDPQAGGLWHGVDVTCGVCGRGIAYGDYTCPQGHPAAKATFSITVQPPEDIPDDDVAPTRSTELRFFAHPDGRRWGVRVDGHTVEFVIVLPDGERLERARKHLDNAEALRDMQDRIAKQVAGGFVEQPAG